MFIQCDKGDLIWYNGGGVQKQLENYHIPNLFEERVGHDQTFSLALVLLFIGKKYGSSPSLQVAVYLGLIEHLSTKVCTLDLDGVKLIDEYGSSE